MQINDQAEEYHPDEVRPDHAVHQSDGEQHDRPVNDCSVVVEIDVSDLEQGPSIEDVRVAGVSLSDLGDSALAFLREHDIL